MGFAAMKQRARTEIAEDIEKMLVQGKGNTKVLPEAKEPVLPWDIQQMVEKGKARLRKRRKGLKKMKMKPKPTAHVTAVLPRETTPSIHSSPTLNDVNRTDRWHIYSATTAKVASTSQG